LKELIEGVTLNNGDDTWIYWHEIGCLYTVCANYSYLYKRFLPLSPTNAAKVGFESKVWGSWTPSKVLDFSWKALLGLFPTRLKLGYRWIIPHGEATICTWSVGTS
jgi:hypothetical protein